MDTRDTARTGVVALLVMTSAATIGLHALGSAPEFAVDWHRPLAWLDSSDPSDAVGAIFRLVGLGIGYWVLATTTVCYLITWLRRGRRPRWLTLVTLPPIRRMVDRALAASLAVSLAATPIASLRSEESAQPPPPAVVFEVPSDGIPVPHVGAADDGPAGAEDDMTPVGPDTTEAALPPEDPIPAETAPSEAVAVLPLVVAPSPNPPAARAATEYTVERGDNLWSIAASHLRGLDGSTPTMTAVDSYWRAVIAANRDTLRSGDPNLIYPGEIISLPASETTR